MAAWKVRGLTAVVLAAVLALGFQIPDSSAEDVGTKAGQGAWTLEEALEHLELYPRDAYVQYVALQLARREGRTDEVAQQIETFTGRRNQWQERRDEVTLFSIFSGQLAVQESLQLDAMRGEQADPQQQPVDTVQGRVGPRPIGDAAGGAAPRTLGGEVAVTSIEGPTIKSHPWAQMLAGRKPQISTLARKVPEDNYFIEFRSVDKLIEASELTSLWGAHFLNQSVQEAQSQLVNQRLRTQLAIEVNELVRPVYDQVVEEVAVTGSDVFMREGSDVTLLFKVRQPEIFRGQMEQFILNARRSRPEATRSGGQYLGVKYEHVSTPDRQIHVYSAWPEPNIHVRSNSRVGLERVLAAIKGETADGQAVRALGDTTEFAYIRTLMPMGAEEEDGLIYLSDPFIRRLVGPKLRLTEQRRMFCYNHLKMIGHAALMHRTERGENADSLDDLAEADCSPGQFGHGDLVCPDGGRYTLGPDGLTGVCSHHGYASNLTPCCEIEATHVTDQESVAYNRFLQAYNSYWRTFFDPIAIRLKISPERYRAETIVLPLIDNSIYTGLARALGSGKPEALDALPVPKRNIFTLAVRLDKRAIMSQLGMEELLDVKPAHNGDEAANEDRGLVRTMSAFRQISLAMLNYEAVHKTLPPAGRRGRKGESLLSWRVELLPYLEQQALYDQFHRDEPWDSEHNRKLIARMPEFFRPSNLQLAAAGKTKIVSPRGESTLLATDNKPIGLRHVSDGTSQTILLAEADDAHAVVWTRPDDLDINLDRPHDGLQERPRGTLLMATCDGAMHVLDKNITREALAALMTRSGGERVDWSQFDRPEWGPPPRQHIDPQFAEMIRQLNAGELLAKGIGNQVGFHVYDAKPMFDLSLSRALGQSLGSFNGGMFFDDDFIGIGLLLGSLNSPVYVSIPVRDADIVDRFLEKLDHYLAKLANKQSRGGFFEIDQDFYRLEAGQGYQVRSYGLRLWAVKWRFFWSRIGNAVYLASKREILDDLYAMESASDPSTRDDQLKAHAMVRIRPEHWDQVLDHFQLGWEESNREACLRNLGPLSSLNRALAAGDAASSGNQAQLDEYAARLYDVRYFCPDGGRYEIDSHGRGCTCSKHGSPAMPRQSASPDAGSELGKLINQFADMSVALTFLDDGLHAVVTLDRKAAK